MTPSAKLFSTCPCLTCRVALLTQLLGVLLPQQLVNWHGFSLHLEQTQAQTNNDNSLADLDIESALAAADAAQTPEMQDLGAAAEAIALMVYPLYRHFLQNPHTSAGVAGLKPWGFTSH